MREEMYGWMTLHLKGEGDGSPVPEAPITTEDPENNFVPDYGRVTAYRSPAGFGIRLDAGTAYAGAIITRFYDSLLVKVTAWSPTPEETIARMHRALWEFRIRGVVTNLRFLDQLINDPDLRGQFRSDPEATMIKAGLDEAARTSLAAQKWNELGDEELGQRISKGRW